MPISKTIAWSDVRHADHAKIWKVLLRTERQGLLVLLSRALRILPPNRLESVFRGFAQPHEVGAVDAPATRSLIEETRSFVDAALRGAFYEEFMVNSRNCMDKSSGTQVFEAQLDLLIDRCFEESATGDPAQACIAFELLFELLREIDRWEREIVFFADEGGTWQFGLDWRRVVPFYFQCLRATHDSATAQRMALTVVDDFAGPDADSIKAACGLS